MKTAIVSGYGPPDVLRIVDTVVPVIAPHQVLVRVVATSVTAADWRMRSGVFPKGFTPFARMALGVFSPRRKVLGTGYSGVIETVGARVSGFAPGDEVCGACGGGAWAEYVRVDPGKSFTRKPAGVPHDQAAALLFGGLTALYFLRDRASVAAGQRVLILGAAGVVGSHAVQISRHFGANVTAAARGEALDFVSNLGADRVIDYTRTDVNALDEQFDIVFDASGTISVTAGRRLLAENGVLALAAANLYEQFARKQVVQGMATEKSEDIATLLDMVEQGSIAPAIDSVWPLDEIVAANHRFETGGRQGVVLIHPGG